jgi:hypothetical protein
MLSTYDLVIPKAAAMALCRGDKPSQETPNPKGFARRRFFDVYEKTSGCTW